MAKLKSLSSSCDHHNGHDNGEDAALDAHTRTATGGTDQGGAIQRQEQSVDQNHRQNESLKPLPLDNLVGVRLITAVAGLGSCPQPLNPVLQPLLLVAETHEWVNLHLAVDIVVVVEVPHIQHYH